MQVENCHLDAQSPAPRGELQVDRVMARADAVEGHSAGGSQQVGQPRAWTDG